MGGRDAVLPEAEGGEPENAMLGPAAGGGSGGGVGASAVVEGSRFEPASRARGCADSGWRARIHKKSPPAALRAKSSVTTASGADRGMRLLRELVAAPVRSCVTRLEPLELGAAAEVGGKDSSAGVWTGSAVTCRARDRARAASPALA